MSGAGSAGLETPARIEPCFFEDGVPPVLADLAVEIQQEADKLGRGLHPDSAAELAGLVRLMNCYYSNLIEGHNTRPKDIERAVEGAEVAEAEPERRALALEARAHVLIQHAIDKLHRQGDLGDPTSVAFLKWLHRSFYQHMPAEFRFMERRDGSRIEIRPGEFRSTPEEDIEVGNHRPPSSARVAAFMDHFAMRFGPLYAPGSQRRAGTRIIAMAAAHHRLNYIHPFPDGNGRVSRLMTHAQALVAGIGGHGLWSVSRGLARGLRDRGEYPRMMDYADSPRRGDLDGRGNLSLSALADFSEWFLSVALDQIRFCGAMFDFERLEDRYGRLVADVIGNDRATALATAVLRQGSLPRGDAQMALRTSERSARSVVSELVSAGFLKSATPKGPVRVAFPLDYRERLFPNLFTDAEVAAPRPPELSEGSGAGGGPPGP